MDISHLPPHVPVTGLRDRALYRARSRNLGLVVCDAATNSFFGIRIKFGRVFIDNEYHWDTGADGSGTFGTCRPLEDLGETLPDDVALGFNHEEGADALLEWIKAAEERHGMTRVDGRFDGSGEWP